jgi:inosine/xanthosine triphosphatase
MKIAVGSTNPVKINAVKLAFKKVFKNQKIIVKGIEVSSGITNQPMSDKESLKGAHNRAKKSLNEMNFDFGVGIEGGLQKIGNNWFDCGWVIVIDRKLTEGIGTSIRMQISSKMIKMVKTGLELGEVDDLLFKTNNSKQQQGHFGLMTNNLVSREKCYTDAVLSALSRFIHPEIFE